VTLEEIKAKYGQRFDVKNSHMNHRFHLYVKAMNDQNIDNSEFASWNTDNWYEFCKENECKTSSELYKKLDNETETKYNQWLEVKVNSK
jgi:hypothetical protein